jgi:hypothetical protein
MKKIILIMFILLSIKAGYSQGDRIYQIDSLKAGELSTDFVIATKHNFNTFTVTDLSTGDSIRVYHVNESGDTTPISVRDLNTYIDLETNLITGMSGNHEFLVLNPNIYKLVITCTSGDVASKTIYIRRRGNNLK